MQFETEESLDCFIAAFEDGSWPSAEWKHAHHLVMATCYVLAYGRDEALTRARVNIAKYNEAQGGENTADSGYHETLTVFWIDRVAEAIPKEGSRVEAVRHVVDQLAPKRDVWRRYYSFDVVKSQEARSRYVAPDWSVSPFPQNGEEFGRLAQAFRSRLQALKDNTSLPSYGWYPYDSLTAAPVLQDLLGDALPEIGELALKEPVADLGCGDGDIGLLFASLGCSVHSVDLPDNNFNQMLGVKALRDALPFDVEVHEVNLDYSSRLPSSSYSLAIFLGTLYHLKNPYLALDTLANASAFCLLSTRIAQQCPSGLRIENEPLAYLLGAREANNDPTNYWIFSEAALHRLIQRTGWSIERQVKLGAAEGSDPVRADADQRIFLLLRSRVRFAGLRLGLIDGWFPLEDAGWRWTAKRFSFDVLLPDGANAREFALRVHIPEILLQSSPVEVTCETGGTRWSQTFTHEGSQELRGAFPDTLDQTAPIRIDCTVEHGYRSLDDHRDLGIIVPFRGDVVARQGGVPFRIS